METGVIALEAVASEPILVYEPAPPAAGLEIAVLPVPLWKRTLDLLIAIPAALVALPVVAVLLVVIKLGSEGSPLLVQERIGQGGRPFRLLKLRTMVKDADQKLAELVALNEAEPPLFKIRRDPRVTPVGRVLRATSLDELPQLWNVIKGDMSLVGPRPPLPHEVVSYTPQQARRLSVLPGLTGLWQVRSREPGSFGQAVSHDLEYVHSLSFWLDLTILARTFHVVLARRGGY